MKHMNDEPSREALAEAAFEDAASDHPHNQPIEDVIAEEKLPAADFESWTITVDHLQREPHPSGETCLKIVMSNVDAHQALLNQIDYFSRKGEGPNLLMDKRHVSTLAMGLARKGIYYYTPSARLSNIIIDKDAFEQILTNPDLGKGSFLETCKVLIADLAQAVSVFADAGAPAELIFVDPASVAAEG